MVEANQNGETQPQTQEKTITELYELVESIKKQLTVEIDAVRKEIPDEQKIKMIVSNTLTDYSTTTEIHKIVSNAIAGINRGMSDGFSSVNKKMDEFIEVARQRLTSLEEKHNRNADEIEITKIAIDESRNNYATVKANQDQLIVIATRMDNAIRGDGETNGLVGQNAATTLEVQRLSSEMKELTRISADNTRMSAENSRLYRELARREDMRSQAQEQRRQTLWKWAVRLARVAGVVVTGGGGVAAADLLGRLIGG